MKKLLLLLPLLLCSCAAVPIVAGPGVAYGLKAIKNTDTRAKVACEVKAVANSLATSTSVVDTEGVKAVLEQQLPNDELKPLTESTAIAAYGTYYPMLVKLVPEKQLPAYQAFWSAAAAGASVYCPTATASP